MNLAFQDAEVLGHCLEAVEYDVDRVDEAAARYSALRRQAIARVLRRTHLMGLMAAMRRPVAIRVRQALLGLLDRQPWCKRRIFERIVDVR
jgi:2-polyprenyl-6-methoxyphenol hydroxylase-like FAD-dependent oxidoreductase